MDGLGLATPFGSRDTCSPWQLGRSRWGVGKDRDLLSLPDPGLRGLAPGGSPAEQPCGEGWAPLSFPPECPKAPVESGVRGPAGLGGLESCLCSDFGALGAAGVGPMACRKCRLRVPHVLLRAG